MNKKLVLPLIVFLFLSDLISCKNKIDVFEVLSSKTWVFNRVDNKDDPNNPDIGLLNVLFKDAKYNFKADGKYSSVMLTGNVNGTWNLSEDKKYLNIFPDANTQQEFEILIITPTQLVWKDVDGFYFTWN